MNRLQAKAYNAGYRDACCGRTYRHSFTPGSQLRVAQMHAEYQRGWQTARAKKPSELAVWEWIKNIDRRRS